VNSKITLICNLALLMADQTHSFNL